MSLAQENRPLPAMTLPRHDWTRADVRELFALPFPELMFRAAHTHRENFDPAEVQISTLLSIKTGGCPEDCAYCPQAARYDTGVKAEKLMGLDAVLGEARAARRRRRPPLLHGRGLARRRRTAISTRSAPWSKASKRLGLETCATLGMLTAEQAARLKASGLDYYNHNLDTSPEFYGAIITTRTYQDRLDTLDHVRSAGIHVCCGGIVGMGETLDDRVGMIATWPACRCIRKACRSTCWCGSKARRSPAGTKLDPLDFVRTIAVARICMPASVVRLSAGREDMSEETQALCFLAGANSIFYGPKLLTTPNPGRDRDMALLDRLGLRPMA